MATLTGISGGGGAFANFAALGNAGIARFATMIPLISQGNSGGSSVYATLRKHGELTGYQVPAGKKLVIVGGLIRITNAQNCEFGVGHGNNDVGWNSATPPSDLMQNFDDFIPNTIAFIFTSFMKVIPEGRYPHTIIAIGSGTYFTTIHGYEIDAEATSI